MPSTIGFLYLRYKRLIPWAAAGAIASAVLSGSPLLHLAAALLFLPLPTATNMFPVNSARWSLFFELVCNVLHALIFARLATRYLVLLSSLILLAMCLTLPSSWPVPVRPHQFLDGFTRAILPYCVGILLYRWSPRFPAIGNFSLTALYVLGFTSYFVFHPIGFGLFFSLVVAPVLVLAGANAKEGWTAPAKWMGAISYPVYITQGPILALLF